MVVVAVLLLLVVALVVVAVLFSGATGSVPLDWHQTGLHLSVTPLELFLAGAGALLLAEVALGLVLRSGRRSRARRRELTRLRRVEQLRAHAPGEARVRPAGGAATSTSTGTGTEGPPAGAQDGTSAGLPPSQAGAHEAGAHEAPGG